MDCRELTGEYVARIVVHRFIPYKAASDESAAGKHFRDGQKSLVCLPIVYLLSKDAYRIMDVLPLQPTVEVPPYVLSH